jgi:hypothetical protein
MQESYGIPYSNINLGATGQVVKASEGRLKGYYLYNGGSAARFVKIYNKATAPDENDTPVLTLPLPAGAAANLPTSITFSAGISVRATTGVAANDTGAPGSNEVVVNIFYA